MVDAVVLGLAQVLHHRPGGGDTVGHPVDAEALEGAGLEMILKGLPAETLGKSPVVQHVGTVGGAEDLAEADLHPPLVQHFAGRKRFEQFDGLTLRTFRNEELPGGDVQESYADPLLPKMHRRQEVVPSRGEHLIVHRHPGGDELRYAAFDDLFGQFRVFQLVAHRYPPTGQHQFGQIGVDGVVRETGHRRFGGQPGATLGEYNA